MVAVGSGGLQMSFVRVRKKKKRRGRSLKEEGAVRVSGRRCRQSVAMSMWLRTMCSRCRFRWIASAACA